MHQKATFVNVTAGGRDHRRGDGPTEGGGGRGKESSHEVRWSADCKGGSTLVTLPRIVTPYRDSVDKTRARVTYQKLVMR
jgi:hypothetical protein